jgi:catechol 2,3-dioxygenase
VLKLKIEAGGRTSQDAARRHAASTGRMLQFTLPSGHDMRLYAMKECASAPSVGSTNPDPGPADGIKGAGALA